MAKPLRVHKCSPTDSLEYVTSVSLKMYEALDTPKSLMCYMLLEAKEYEQLITIEVNAADYLDRDSFFKDYQAICLLKKYPFKTDIDKKAVALKKFLEAEEQCKNTNDNFDEVVRPYSDLLHYMKSEVSRILGRCPDIKSLPFMLGPGASGQVSGFAVTIPDKFNNRPIQCSTDAIPYAEEWIKTLPHIYAAKYMQQGIDGKCSVPRPAISIQNFNQLSFVPKNGKTDRCICIEPDFMIPMQKAYGTSIRNRLKVKAGIDLQVQQVVNARYARKGSIDDSYATIDMASASDTISLMLVAEVLPLDWFRTLSALRSPFTNIGSKKEPQLIENEKFSSMGNGFTFELESLIFYAAASAVRKKAGISGTVMSYGDDIIVPTEIAPMLVDFLSALGFKTNNEKSFLSGPFRESCGKDYFCGLFVRPQFIKEEISYETDKFKTANSIRQFAMDLYNFHSYSDSSFLGVWNFCVSRIPKAVRVFGPLQFGDSVLFSPYGERRSYTSVYGIVDLPVAVFRSARKPLSGFASAVQTASALYGSGSNITIRGRGHVELVRRKCTIWCTDIGSWG